MESMQSFFKKLSTLKSAVKRGEKVHGVYLFITPNYQLVAISDPYCKHGETRDKARLRGKVEYELVDLDCSKLTVPICLGSLDTVYKRIREDFRLGRERKERASNLSYCFSEEYQKDITELADKLEEGAISQTEYETIYRGIEARYQREAEEKASLLPYDRSCFDVELVGTEIQYCYNLELFDQLELTHNPTNLLVGENRTLSARLVPGLTIPAIPSPLRYKDTSIQLEKLRGKYSDDYTPPFYWNFSAVKDSELETLIRERQARKEARDKAIKAPKTALQKAIDKEAREAEKARKRKTPKQSFRQDTRGAIELYSNSGKGVKVYHDISDKKYLIFADTPEKYHAFLTSHNWSFRADLGGVFRYGAKGERGREALKNAIAYFNQQ